MTEKTQTPRRMPAPAALTAHYGAIGPAALLAALMFAPRSRAKHALPLREAA